MPDKPNPYRAWMVVATAGEKRRVAELANLGHDYVAYQLGRPYMPSPGVPAAAALEKALAIVGRGRPEYPVVTRADISPVCAECPYVYRLDPNGAARAAAEASAPTGCPSSRMALDEDEERA